MPTPTRVASTNLWRTDGGPGTNTTYSGGTPLVIPSGLPNPCLVLFLHSYHATTDVRLDSSTGAQFQRVAQAETASNGQRAEIWILKNPATDGVTGHTIWVQTDYKLGEAYLTLWQDVDQTTTVGAAATTTTGASSTPFSVPVPSAVGDIVVAAVGASSLSGVTQDGTLTLLGGPFNGSVSMAVSAYSKAGASGTTTVGFTTDGAHFVALAAVALKPATGGGGGGPTAAQKRHYRETQFIAAVLAAVPLLTLLTRLSLFGARHV